MKVAELQSFLRSLTGPLAASGGKKIADDLSRAAGGLQPFAEMTVAQFGEFLEQAAEYQQTGLLPVKAGGRKQAAAAVDPQRTRRALEDVRNLYERVGSDSVDYSTIEREIAVLNKLKKDELIEVARGFGIASTLKTKKDALEAIRRRITERKESVQRTQF